jgi:hypothetical protein
VNNGGERREGGGGVKVRIFSLFVPRVEVGRHQSDRWWAPVRPVVGTGQTGAPLRKRF